MKRWLIALAVAAAALAAFAGPFAGFSAAPGANGNGTVTDLTVVNVHGISGTVANSTTTPAISLTLGAITPSTVTTGTVTTSVITGTPTMALTNATGLSISTGVSGLAANVSTFLGTPTFANLSVACSTCVGVSPINSQSATYTTVLTDAGKTIYHPPADTSTRTFTIDSNANVPYPLGTTITFDNDVGAGTITLTVTADAMVLVGAAGTAAPLTVAPGARATALKVATARWRVGGSSGVN